MRSEKFKRTVWSVLAVGFIVLFAVPVPVLASATWLSSIGSGSGVDMQSPTRVALDPEGNLYVSDPRNNMNRVLIFDRLGKMKSVLTSGLNGPRALAVDANGRIYVGNDSGNVNVYNTDLTLAFKLGKGEGEFSVISTIAVSSSGRIYVVDGKANCVKIYDQNGVMISSFGSYGQGAGKFNTPLAIAIDETAANGSGELYVTDLGLYFDSSNKLGSGARVQVFDLNGVVKTSFGEFGSGQGQMVMPMGIAEDGNGLLYITDSSQSSVHVFTATGVWQETITDKDRLKTPLGIAIGKDRRMFVASSNGHSVEVYGLPGYTTMSVSKESLFFTAEEGGSDPVPQNVTLTNGGSGTLDWIVESNAVWLKATANGKTAASENSLITITPVTKATGLTQGTYSGTLTIKATSGAQETISVSLTVTPPSAVLTVTPSVLNFKAQQGGSDPLPQIFAVDIKPAGKMTWSPSSTATWLKLGSSSSVLTVSPSTAGFPAGTYEGTITINASGAQGSPATVSAKVQVIFAGTIKVTSNLANASFDITGPASYTASGTSWSNTEAVPGDYTITFNRIAGYTKPLAKKFTLETGKEISIAGDYGKKPVPTHVLAGSADTSLKAMTLAVLPIDPANAAARIVPFANADSLRAAAGDLDNTGSDKIVVTDFRRTVKVFSDRVFVDPTSPALASYELPEGYQYADIAVGDIDNDGNADIILIAENSKQPRRTVKVLSYTGNSLTEKATVFTEDKEGGFSIALGDMNDDGALEVFVADVNSVRAFSVQQSATGMSLSQLWSRSGDFGKGSHNTPQIAAGDLNGDGIAEIAVSYDRVDTKETRSRGREKEKVSLISILKGGTGEDFPLTIEPFKDLGYTRPATLAIADNDGDFADELIAGSGPAENNEPVIRMFESDGSYAGVTMKPLNGKFGVNVGVGSFR